MTTPAHRDRSHESVVNDALARVLRERHGLDAVAETLHGGRRPDILVRLRGRSIILETEFAPARTVEADALSRLGMEIDGRKVQNVFAVVIPASLRSVSQRLMYERLATATLHWQEWRSDGTAGLRLDGSATELAEDVRHATPPKSDLDDAVKKLDEGVRRAGSHLYFASGSLGRVANILNTEPGDEAAHMTALVIINAMIFQERLAKGGVAFRPVSEARISGYFSKVRLLQLWEHILSIDYHPIFGMARDLVNMLTGVESPSVLDECHRTVSALLSTEAVGRHDLAGRIFNRLISERKLLAAFYTSIPASTLLAGLALSSDNWEGVDWGKPEDIADLRVVDPACGTGTLLMAAYRQIVQNHQSASPADSDGGELHKLLMENVISGADVVQSAIHLTAATLAAMSPSVEFKRMPLYSFRLGTGLQNDLNGGESREVYLGSLDWLQASEIQSTFSAAEEQIGATENTGGLVERPRADLVISNPPFTRRSGAPGKGESIARVFSIPEGDEESKKAIAKRTSALLRGTPANQIAGHASSFTVLADRIVKPGGRIALVLPVTALFGEAWRQIRGMLSCRYEIEFVVTSHDPKLLSMSFDTGIAEALLIARRLKNGEHPSGRGKFVNLWRAAYHDTDALALARAINATASSPMLQSDGPPAGGSALVVGDERWGEMVDGPVGEGSWKPARWKRALVGQFAAALERGEIWTDDGVRVIGRVPVSALSETWNVSPDSQQIRGPLGVFNGYHGTDEYAQFPSLWSLDSRVHNKMAVEPNAWLIPKPGRDHRPRWAQAGTLQITRSIRYTSQPITAVRTNITTLGFSSWFSLRAHEEETGITAVHEAALALWCNSTLGMALHANHASSSQLGRGRGNKGMLETMTTLDVRKLQPWQLEEAEAIWRDFKDKKFQPFYKCAVDPTRIALDERLVRDVLGLGEDAVASVARLSTLLASEPSIHGTKKPALPS